MPMAGIDTILERKRDGLILDTSEIDRMIRAIVTGDATRAQAAAFLAFVFSKGMTFEETVALTMSMADSGERLNWNFDGLIADKHSTGGVGDKVSLVLAPLWVTLGARVPMISGRGLGHTGGTLDKLESISGFRTDLAVSELRRIFDDVGCFISGQTASLAPADRILYALRNETCTVPCIPLIVASILSKKIAEGIDTLVLDVKFGSGAFMQTREEAEELAKALVAVGTGAGLSVNAALSDMNQPLGFAVGNSVEVEEAVACLQGRGPDDLADLVCELIDHPDAARVLASGAAHETWERMVHAQGGDLSTPLLGNGCQEMILEAEHSGFVARCDALSIGRAGVHLGAGRFRADQDIHPGVGFWLKVKVGDFVEKGQPLIRILHADTGLSNALSLLTEAIVVKP